MTPTTKTRNRSYVHPAEMKNPNYWRAKRLLKEAGVSAYDDGTKFGRSIKLSYLSMFAPDTLHTVLSQLACKVVTTQKYSADTVCTSANGKAVIFHIDAGHNTRYWFKQYAAHKKGRLNVRIDA